MEMENLRKEYRKKQLSLHELALNPFDQFRKWFSDTLEAQIPEPNAMALATASLSGKPACRMLLMKHFDEEGLVFFTNYESRKAHELIENPYASALFFWKELERQVLIEGKTDKVSPELSYAYFSKRPRRSRLSAWASHQDQAITSRDILEQEYNRVEKLYENQEIPLPDFWGGFKLYPLSFEFWQGREDRLHDRFRYLRQQDQWTIERLSP